MKRLRCICLAFCLALALAGCTATPAESDTVSSAVMADIDAWPENEYTDDLFPPQSGTPSYTVADEQAEYFSVFYSDITRQQGQQYVDALVADGFSVVADQENEVSAGLLLSKENIWLGISISDGGLGIYISHSSAPQVG